MLCSFLHNLFWLSGPVKQLQLKCLRESPFGLPCACFNARKNYTVKPTCKHNAWLSKRAFSLPIFWDYNSGRLDLAPSDPYWRWTLLIYTRLLFLGKCALCDLSLDFSGLRVPFRFLRRSIYDPVSFTVSFIKTDCHTGLEFNFSVILSRKYSSSVILDRTVPAFDKTCSKQSINSIWYALIWPMLIDRVSYWLWHK